MNNKDVINTLKKEVVIPDAVQKKADEAFAAIHREALNSKKEEKVLNLSDHRKKQRYGQKMKRKIWIAAVVAVLALGTINVTAAYINRSKSLTEGMGVTEQQQVRMQEKHLSTFINQSFTDQGITVTALESVTDHYYTHIAFKVEGYKVDPGVQPDFETVRITIDGQDGYNETAPEDNFNFSGSFYNGFVMGEDGSVENADGTPLQKSEDGSIIENYVMEDGSMEYQITLSNSQKKGFFINKPIHVELLNLGTVGRAAYDSVVRGTWTFDWTLEGSSELKECDLNVPLGDTGASVVKAEISPISLAAVYEFPRRQEYETVVDANGDEKKVAFYAEPPRLMGVRMKDGTSYPYIYLGPGGSGYEAEDSNRYRTVFAIDRILDVDQVESLLFFKSYAEEGKTLENNFYIVPIG